MARYLLSEETCFEHPVVKRWFDQFRVVTDADVNDVDSEILQQQAMELKCMILHGNWCYCEDGSVREVCHELSSDAFENFVQIFKQCTNERATMMAQQRSKYTLDKQKDIENKFLARLDAEKSKLNVKIR